MAYNALADFLLGLPNNGTGIAVAKETQLTNPNSLRWSEYAAYAQDQWKASAKLTITYGLRYEFYPPPYRDHTGVYRLDPTLPQSGNVIVGGVNGQPENAGYQMGWGSIFPRLGIAYRLTDRWVVRTGTGLTSDPDSLRFLRDAFPEDLSPTYSGTATGTVAVDPTTGTPLTLVNRHSRTGFSQLLQRLRFPSRQRVDQYGSVELPPRLYRELEPVRAGRPGGEAGCEHRICGNAGGAAVGRCDSECGAAAKRIDTLHGEWTI
jgi:TonB dependent receptor